MKLYIVDVHYIVALEQIDEYLTAHRAFLKKYVDLERIVCSGRKNPRTGGVIIWKGQSVHEIEKIMNEDPFMIHKLAQISITEMEPTLMQENFKGVLIEKSKLT